MRAPSPAPTPTALPHGAGTVGEMLVVGRGGEGVVLASQLLAATFARAGLWAQTFPEFKAERRGAPLSAFLRWNEASPIHRRYKMQSCDVLLVISPSLPTDEQLRMVRPGGLLVLNRERRLAARGAFRIARVPGSLIAEEHGVRSAEGRPMSNAAMLGACVRLLLPHALGLLEEAMSERLGDLAEPNVAAARDGYARCTMQHACAGDRLLQPKAPMDVRAPLPAYAVTTTDARGNRTGTWAYERPVLTDSCTACGVCALFCPEGAIARHGESMVVDEAHCKGCGICEVVCPVRSALVLEKVEAA